MRLNLFLLVCVLVSAGYLVNVQYESRRLFADINKAEQEGRRLEADFERLQVEKRAQATPGRIEKLAREQLQMRGNHPAITHYVNVPLPLAAPAVAAPPVNVGSPAAQGRIQ
jgi:cell division protein FtsL